MNIIVFINILASVGIFWSLLKIASGIFTRCYYQTQKGKFELLLMQTKGYTLEFKSMTSWIVVLIVGSAYFISKHF